MKLVLVAQAARPHQEAKVLLVTEERGQTTRSEGQAVHRRSHPRSLARCVESHGSRCSDRQSWRPLPSKCSPDRKNENCTTLTHQQSILTHQSTVHASRRKPSSSMGMFARWSKSVMLAL